MGSLVGHIGEETPTYEVLSKTSEYEIRRYGPRLEVCTSMEEGVDEGAPFRRLAGYIGVLSKPQNESKTAQKPETIAMTAPVVMKPKPEPIAMTAPVVMEAGKDSALMSFILPSKYTLETAPKPTNPKVFLRKVEGKIEAVSTFSGRYRMKNCGNKKEELFTALDRDKIQYEKSNWVLMGYNPPWTLPPLRKNEIAVPVVKFSGKD